MYKDKTMYKQTPKQASKQASKLLENFNYLGECEQIIYKQASEETVKLEQDSYRLRKTDKNGLRTLNKIIRRFGYTAIRKFGYIILIKNSKPRFVLTDFKEFTELAIAKEELDKIKKEEENRVKFEKLVSFLKTVPKVEASEEEKKLMSIIDNDEEDQLRIKKIIEERRRLNV